MGKTARVLCPHNLQPLRRGAKAARRRPSPPADRRTNKSAYLLSRLLRPRNGKKASFFIIFDLTPTRTSRVFSGRRATDCAKSLLDPSPPPPQHLPTPLAL